jgi:hypothetical protein
MGTKNLALSGLSSSPPCGKPLRAGIPSVLIEQSRSSVRGSVKPRGGVRGAGLQMRPSEAISVEPTESTCGGMAAGGKAVDPLAELLVAARRAIPLVSRPTLRASLEALVRALELESRGRRLLQAVDPAAQCSPGASPSPSRGAELAHGLTLR